MFITQENLRKNIKNVQGEGSFTITLVSSYSVTYMHKYVSDRLNITRLYMGILTIQLFLNSSTRKYRTKTCDKRSRH